MKTAKKNLSEFTVKRLRIVRDFVRTHPHNYNQHTARRPGAHGTEITCNTPGCILGWGATIFGPVNPGEEGIGTFNIARKKLRLTTEQAQRLWVACCWPSNFRNEHARTKHVHRVANARNAAKRITHFIRTDGQE